MKHTVTARVNALTIVARDMKVGEIGRVVRPGSIYDGFHIVKMHEGIFMALEQPTKTWSSSCSLPVEVLPAGSELTLVVGMGGQS